eukprot:Blabericola_migrator_1__5309@NODE_2724_length_2423_cov_8_553480_g1706_i0_p3_GENE_NODE_2724_length_2423_cov_8_553480_g1706_i0NODE_2724_length_2423_cov_8_553480_g1706_i0_p3_ORF_typecomplete_len147_score10_88_NODE_2724_length_2423_cov_8_553480_g1706_i06661106
MLNFIVEGVSYSKKVVPLMGSHHFRHLIQNACIDDRFSGHSPYPRRTSNRAKTAVARMAPSPPTVLSGQPRKRLAICSLLCRPRSPKNRSDRHARHPPTCLRVSPNGHQYFSRIAPYFRNAPEEDDGWEALSDRQTPPSFTHATAQ